MRGRTLGPAFRDLWAAQGVSQFGANVTVVALPLVAAVTLHADGLRLGLLTAAGTLPHLLVSPFAGVWVDRHSRRALLVGADLARAALLLAVPVAAVCQVLSLPLLVVLALLIGAQGAVSDVGYSALLPTLVAREDLVRANARFELSASGATVLGSSAGGAAVQLLTGPWALLGNAVAYLVSAAFTWRLPREDRPRAPRAAGSAGTDVWREMRAGAAYVVGSPPLRAVTGATTVFNLFLFVCEPALLLFLTRTLALPGSWIGAVFAASGAGAGAGALVASGVARRFGARATLWGSLGAAGAAGLAVPAAVQVPGAGAAAVIAGSHFVTSALVIVFNVTQRAVRATLTPPELYGRVNASIRTLVLGVASSGGLLGGWLTHRTSAQAVLLVGAVGMTCACAFLLPLRRGLPEGGIVRVSAKAGR
ncbi:MULTISPECIES: MFS transporter [unclassified Streptomyces]|uniref:MFS transporter n=1 Tax=unclassified Streptomyces TaxID=2593676 RepID=UPI000DBA4413|nr:MULTISPECIES: MFS transporter [unclassified Streptomyces]MYT68234.1 MFS transporter [Streptomyces sp. SID8367]RAJ76866.1 putative MFS family arabinose efflux permease [Streptomyces sp. PsTaAH-137]